jgi:hypothetical protein
VRLENFEIKKAKADEVVSEANSSVSKNTGKQGDEEEDGWVVIRRRLQASAQRTMEKTLSKKPSL